MKDYTHLSSTDRRRLYVFLEMKLGLSEIAKRLSRHRSTIYREIAGNKEEGGYLPGVSQLKREERAKASHPGKLETDGILRAYVIQSLKKGWSPEQISGRMKLNKLSYYACPETIYQFIYQNKKEGFYAYLPYKKPKRGKRQTRKERFCRYGDRRLITQRPEEINTRKRFGHWEGDTIEFRGTKKKVVTTLVERKSRVVYLLKNNSKHSQDVMGKIKEKLGILPHSMCQTITFDQGSEFTDFGQVEEHIKKCRIYYCEAHSPWQKGSNENMNGRLRWHLPRETDIAKISQAELDALADKMNHCPRKCLGFKTPHELFIQQYKNACRTWG